MHSESKAQVYNQVYFRDWHTSAHMLSQAETSTFHLLFDRNMPHMGWINN